MRHVFIIAAFIASCLLNGCNTESENIPDENDSAFSYEQGRKSLSDFKRPRWIDSRPYLSKTSLWFQDIDINNRPKLRELGCIGIGNGHVFGILGNQYPVSSWHNLGGPTYQKKSKWFSDKIPLLIADGKLRLSKRQFIKRLKNAPVVIAGSYNNELEWTSINFAPKYENEIKAEKALISIWVVRNISGEKFNKVNLNIHSTLGFYRFYKGAAIESDGGERFLTIKPIGSKTFSGIDLRTLSICLGSLEPEEEKIVFLPYVFTRKGDNPDEIFSMLEAAGPDRLLESTVKWWEDWISQITEIETPDEKFNDLLKGLAIGIKVNQSVSGGLSQMSEYSFTWLRDTYGPSLYYPLIGLSDDYKVMLDYLWSGSLNEGNLSNAYELDYDINNLPAEPDWDNLGTMSGRTRAEGPSTLVLQYENYYRTTGDILPIENRWKMLKHAVLDQKFVDGCLLHFSGDETFEDLMEAVLGENLLNEPDESTLSFYSSLLMIRASLFMAEMAWKLGYEDDAALFSQLSDKVRQACEETFWIKDKGYYAVKVATDSKFQHLQPYEDVNTMPIWLKVPLDETRIKSNIDRTIELLGHPEGLLYSKLPSIYRLVFTDIKKGVLTGMSHGYFLNNLDKTFHPMADAAFMRWKDVFSASGNLDEAVVVDDFGHLSILREPFGFVSDVSARYRSWEAGIMGYAFLYHLTGYEPNVAEGMIRLSPQLPPEWGQMSFKGLSFGKGRFDLKVERSGSNGIQVCIKTDRYSAFRLHLTLPSDSDFSYVTVNEAPVLFTINKNSYGRNIIRVNRIELTPDTKTLIRIY